MVLRLLTAVMLDLVVGAHTDAKRAKHYLKEYMIGRGVHETTDFCLIVVFMSHRDTNLTSDHPPTLSHPLHVTSVMSKT